MRRALCLLGVAAVVCWVAAPSSRSADGFTTTNVQGFLAAIPASFNARAPAPAMLIQEAYGGGASGSAAYGTVGQWGAQPVNQGAVFGKRPQEPESHPGMQQSWANRVITGPGAPSSPIRGQAQDRQMDHAWAAGTISARDGMYVNAGASNPMTIPSAPIPAAQEDAAKQAWLNERSRDPAPNAAPAGPAQTAWATGGPINARVAAGPTPRQTPPADGQMHNAWAAVNAPMRANAQSKFTENDMLGPGSSYYPR